MRRLIVMTLLGFAVAVGGCATTGPQPSQRAAVEEWPSGPGTIPPSWYDYNPAYLHWYSPWFHNPEIPK